MRERMPLIVSLVAAGGLMVGCAAEGGAQAIPPTPDTAPPAAAAAPLTPSPETNPSSENAPSPATIVGHAAIQKDVIITFYAYVDNDPGDNTGELGSTAVAHPDIQAEAGGTGTYEDPLTAAARSDVSEMFKPGTKFYVKFLEKYFVRSDDCGESASAPDGCETQIDLYMGNPSRDKAVLDCEDELTPDDKQTVIIDPPKDLPVSEQPLWSDETSQCFNR